MVKYLEIRNTNQNIVIDDQFKTPTFLRKVTFSGNFTEIGSPVAGAQTVYCWKYREIKSFIVKREICKEELGLDPESILNEGDLTLVFARNNISTSFYATASLRYVKTDDAWLAGSKVGDLYITMAVYTDSKESVVTVALYTNNTRLPSKFGKQAFDAQGNLTFDAVRGVMSHVGTLKGDVNLNQEVAATYTFTLPEGCNPSNLYISNRSTLPIRTAYKIGSSGVSMSWTKFAPIMYVDVNTNTLTVKLTRQTNLRGSNSASNIGGFYENVIYCTYPDKELPASQR